jgi:hypothetical protein
MRAASSRSTVDVAGIDRVDVYVDGRPRTSADVSDGSWTITVADVAGASDIQLEGFDADQLVAATTETL